jgi:hypothetical protein
MCFNSRCNGTDFLCGKCKKQYPALAASLAEKKRSRRNGNGRRAGRVAGAIVSGAITVTGATTNLPQSGSQPLKNVADSTVQSERSNRGRTQRGGTRDQGNRNGGSGQQ